MVCIIIVTIFVTIYVYIKREIKHENYEKADDKRIKS